MKRPHSHADDRPRIWIQPNRDGTTANWSRHPAGKPRFATSPGAALDAALAGLNGAPAVIIWNSDFAQKSPENSALCFDPPGDGLELRGDESARSKHGP